MNKNKHIAGWLRVVLFLIPYLLIAGYFQILGHKAIGLNYGDESIEPTAFQHVIIYLFTMIGSFIPLALFMKFVDKEPFVNLGFQPKWKEFWVGNLVGLVIMTFGFGILITTKQITFQGFHFDFNRLFLLTILYLIVAITEEALLRGYVLKNLMLSTNKYVALIISSALFAAMHLGNPNVTTLSMLDLFLAGIVLGISYVYTKNLWFPIGMHLSWNLFQSLLGFNVSGLDTYSLIETKMVQPNQFNGGDFGFEGSYLAVFSEIITILCIVWYYNRNPHLKLS